MLFYETFNQTSNHGKKLGECMSDLLNQLVSSLKLTCLQIQYQLSHKVRSLVNKLIPETRQWTNCEIQYNSYTEQHIATQHFSIKTLYLHKC